MIYVKMNFLCEPKKNKETTEVYTFRYSRKTLSTEKRWQTVWFTSNSKIDIYLEDICIYVCHLLWGLCINHFFEPWFAVH